jgi:succinoglycan biosynthesis protein ExoO
MRYVFITDELPRPGFAGHLALNFAILSWLRQLGHEVVVLLVGARLAGPLEHYGFAHVVGPQVVRLGGRLAPRSPRTAARILARALLRLLPARLAGRVRGATHGANTVLGSFAAAPDLAWCGKYVARARPDAVLIDTIFRAGLLAEPGMSNVNSVIIAHDVFHRRHQALTSAGYAVRPARLTRADEAAWLCGARHIAAIQPDEARLLAAMCPIQNVFLTPMPAIPAPPPPGQMRLPGRLVFVGSAALPNIDGLRWFLSDVWPLLQGRGITLDLVGNCAATLPRTPAGVARLGRVADLAPVLHRACLAIAPLRVGSGLKVKLLDYARHGLFTIATPASLEGFAPDAQAPFISANGPAAFAQAILHALDTPPPPGPALDYVARHYGQTASFAALGRALLI